MQNKLEYWVLLFFVKIFSLLGIDRAASTSAVLSRFLYYVIPLRKEVVRKNLKMAFPDKSEEEIKRLTLSNYKSLITILHEVSCFFTTPKEKVLSRVNYTNIDIVNKELENNKGALLLSAHFGNWEYAGLSLNSFTTKQFCALAKPQRNGYVNKWINDARELFGTKVVSLGLGVREIFNELKSGSAMLMVSDQRGPSDGLRVKFFGQDTAVYIGTAAIAYKTKAPIFFFLMVRNENQVYEAVFERINYEQVEGTKEEVIAWITQEYMFKLETALKKYPEQWFWMHNIWKY
ncbi:MAG: acyltransferase [Melioribacteraceae bacterium]|nr:MAG: acyltransferase [Melioribacteraceae bacterium]